MNKNVSFSALLLATAIAFGSVGGGSAAPQEQLGTPLVLTKRTDDGPYGTSAFSFRYATQDVAIHKNDVDLVFNGCGLLHISPMTGLKNRIAKVYGLSLKEATDSPKAGWKTECIEPQANGLYVMEIDDGTTRMRIKLHITSVTDKEIHLEWAPFRDMTAGLGGTMGKCTGGHASK